MQGGSEEILAEVKTASGRRIFGVVMLVLLALMTGYIALFHPPKLGYAIFLLVIAGLSIWQALRLQAAGAVDLRLTQSGLFDSSGACLAMFDDIAAVDRGMFAFKPSNGFLLKLKAPGPRAWRPGLWWRIGRRIGVGGMTSAPQTKIMADILAAMIMERDKTPPSA